MRTMLRVTIPVEAGNKGIVEGTLPKIVQDTVERIKPESVYFTLRDGKRTAYFVFDMKDSSLMPAIGEPFFMGLNAEVEFQPAMTIDDLKTGLGALKR